MQSVNFYFEQYRPKPLSFDSRFALVSLLVALVGLTTIAMIESIKVDKLNNQHQHLQQQVDLQQQQLIQISQKLKRQVNINDWKAQLANKKQQYNSYLKIDAMLGPINDVEIIAFSQVMSELAKVSVNNLWLTQIKMSKQNLTLNGSTTKASAIPNYVESISQKETLQRQFDELKIERHVDDNRIITFQLNNGRVVDES